MHLSSKIYRKLIRFFAYKYFILEKYDYDNNQKLQPEFFWEPKMESFCEATNIESPFSFYLREGNFLYNYFNLQHA